ncbi:MAG: PPOX class F420-dependent oxidoreductase [Caldilineaceae bacterium]|nr:PPOX class F420-dependent oxidoreductase [Caldilineaceae bacterium]
MSATIPESHRDLLTGPVFAVLTTLMPDNQPQSSVVWTDFDGENVLVNTVLGRQKARNMAERPKVSLLAIDTNHPFRWVEVRGEVEEMTEEGAAEHIAALAKLYTGSPTYYGSVAPAEQAEKETRVICKIKPTRVVTSGS